MTRLNLAMAGNDCFAQHIGCLITSILQNAGDSETFTFFILDGGISDENRQLLKKVGITSKSELIFLNPDLNLIENLPSLAHFSKNAYLRLFLPEIANVDRMIYLDGDTIVTSSLLGLWNTDLEGASIGVIQDRLMYVDPSRECMGYLHLENAWMFNSGVMLLDMKKLRENGKFRECILWCAEHSDSLQMADQDSLNVLFQHDKKELPARWNMQLFCNTIADKREDAYTRYAGLKGRAVPERGIIHFVGKYKPWHWEFRDRLGKYYWENLKKTPWCDYRPEKPCFHDRVAFFLRRNWLNRKIRKLCNFIRDTVRGKKKK